MKHILIHNHLDETTTTTTPDLTTSNSTQQQQHRHRPTKRVQFSTVQIQEYHLTLGDHPCTMHYPLSLDWPHSVTVREYAVDEYVTSQRQAAYAQDAPVPSSLSSSSSSLWAVRLSRTERYERLRQVTGWSNDELEAREAERQLAVVEECLWMAAKQDDDEGGEEGGGDDDDDDDDDDSSCSAVNSANADAYFAALRSRTSVAPTIGWDVADDGFR